MVSERKEIFGVLLLVVAIAALLSGIHTYRYNLRVKSFEFAAGHWPIVEARVLDLNRSARRAGLTYRPVVCYIFNGIRFTATLDSVNPQVWRDAFARSERVQIYVNPDSPTDAMAASDAVNQYHWGRRRDSPLKHPLKNHRLGENVTERTSDHRGPYVRHCLAYFL